MRTADARSEPAARSLRALDWSNFLLSDVQGGIAPFLSIYLLASLSWKPGMIGVAVAAAGIATVIAQTPAGALIDQIRWKRQLMAIAMVAIAIGSLATAWFSGFVPIVASQVIIGIAGAFLTPMIAALTLGMVGYDRLSERQGRNQVFNHAGNLFAAISAGLMGYFIARVGIFYMAAATAMLSLVAIHAIQARDIDHDLARGSDTPSAASGSIGALLGDRRVLLYSAAVVMFHFANAAMLPLVGQYLATGADGHMRHGASLYMSACIVVAQLTMIPMAAFAGRFSARWGRKPIFLLALLFLPLRALVFALGSDPAFLIAAQVLDGISSGIFGVLNVLIIADLTRGTGRYNITQGMVATAIGMGAALSNLIAGFIVDAIGYSGAFAFLGGVAAIALLVFYLGVPETGRPDAAPGWLSRLTLAGRETRRAQASST